jgi:beta-mannosidase
LSLHIHNESARSLDARLNLQCLKSGELAVIRADREVKLPAHGSLEIPVSSMLESFFDASYAYRFGPPPHDVTIATLTDASASRLADAFHFPLGRGSDRAELGLTATAERFRGGWALRLRCKRLAQSVHIEDEHFRAEDEWFHLAPGVERLIQLTPRDATGALPDGEAHALNGLGPVRFRGSK